MGIKVRFFEPSGKVSRYLRRYQYSDKRKCPVGDNGYCNATVYLDQIERGSNKYMPSFVPEEVCLKNDPLWPTHCEVCKQPFSSQDEYQIWCDEIYQCKATGEESELRKVPVGACWDAWWFGRKGPDGRHLVVRTPGGDWNVDYRARNCTMPEDNVHYCWVRHGSPEDGTLHVDKQGNTCSAGAGSIQSGSYHGFLHHGELT